jgi:A/G-specific adenine glycosylase
MLISSILKNWYLENKRNLPWRTSSNPYYIWVSEVILQQTRVAQGLPYYIRFIETFPTIEALANAPEERLLKIWQGLGYYSRARNMQNGAKFIVENFNGKLPENFNDLLKIKGIGDYTASAIASIAFNLPHAVVDGNVNRVLSRVFGVFEPVNLPDGKKRIAHIADKLMDMEDYGTYNQSVMEFGALQCIPRNPNCTICPLISVCYAYINQKVGELPIKINSTIVKLRYFYYLVIEYDNNVYMRKRGTKDIWKGLFEFPLIETDRKLTLNEVLNSNHWSEILHSVPYTIISTPVNFSHQLSHRKIEVCFIHLKISELPSSITQPFTEISISEIHQLPVSRMIHKYLEKVGW